MAITAWTGPLVSFGLARTSSAQTVAPEYNSQAAPSLFYQGQGILDHRAYYTYKVGGSATTPVYGWWGTDRILTIDAVISAATENSLALTQSATTTTTRTLVLSSVNSVNATVGVSIVRADTGATVTGLVAIEGAAATVTFGSDATVNLWNPATMVARTVRFEGSSDDSAGGFTINGYDVYGFPMTETLTGPISTTAGSTFVTSQKAFKYIASITASGTVNSTGITIGVTDVLGFPLAVQDPTKALMAVSSNSVSWGLVSASTSALISASTVATQTSTTPDVRGTWASTTATSSQGRRFAMYVSPSVLSLASTGLFGAQQA